MQKYKTELNEVLKIQNKSSISKINDEIFTDFQAERKKFGKKEQAVKDTINLITSNLIYYNNSWVSVSMSKRKKNYFSKNGIARYPGYEIQITNHLHKTGFIHLNPGESWHSAKKKNRKASLTAIKITKDAFNKINPDKKDIINPEGFKDECIIIRDAIKDKGYDYFDTKYLKYLTNLGKNTYKNTKKIIEKYNKLAEKTVITCFGQAIPYEKTQVRAVFGITKDLDTKGRLSSGIVNTSKIGRNTYTIQGEETIELDFSCMHISMLFNKNGIQAPDDFYQVKGYPTNCRKAIKFIVNTTLNSKTERGLNSMLSRNLKELKLVPEETNTLGLIRATIFKIKNSEISHELFRGSRVNIFRNHVSDSCGLYLMRLESKIAENIIKHFIQKEIMVIPVYDSFIIQKKYQDELKITMEESYFKELKFKPILK